LRISLRCFYWLVNTRCWFDNYVEEKSDDVYLYLLKIIQVFWLVKNCGWNRHISSVAAQICCLYNMTSLKHIYDIMTSFGRILKIISRYYVTLIYAAYVESGKIRLFNSVFVR
jgi:hypothetical protein